jgi:hypothetical protein
MEMGEISLFSMLGGALDTLFFLKMSGLMRIREGCRTTLAYGPGGRHPARTYARVRESRRKPADLLLSVQPWFSQFAAMGPQKKSNHKDLSNRVKFGPSASDD